MVAMTAIIANLDRRVREHIRHHRALLLFAMQHPEMRSNRLVARAVSKSEASIRKWRKDNDWDHRADALDAEDRAVELYNALYLAEHGVVELPVVISNVVVPMSANPNNQPPPPRYTEDIREADRTVQREILRRRENEKAVRHKHVRLVDGALGYVVGQLNEGKIRASLRDIPTLLKCRDILTGEGGTEEGSGVIGIETVRMRAARAAGADPIAALEADLLELNIIVDALRARRDLPQMEIRDEEEASGLTLVEPAG